MRFAAHVLAAAIGALAGCSSNKPPPAPPQQPYPTPPPQAWAPPPAPPQPAPPLGSNLMDLIAAMQRSVPCPLPGLPPELARLVDCAAMRVASGAVAYVPKALTGALPFEVDHRAQGLTGPVKNQNPVGACAGFAISSVMDNALRRRGRGDVIAPLHVFATYTHHDDMGVLRGKALTVEPVWPFEPVKACRIASPPHQGHCGPEAGTGVNDPLLLGERARADSMGAFRIDAMEYMSAKEIDQMAMLLAEGEAVWVALAFDRAAWSHGSVKSGYLPYYPPRDGLGHAVVLQGYRTGPLGREFLFQNSWGTDWGLGGYLWIPETMLRTHLLHAYRLRVTDAAAAPYVPPSVTVPGGVPSGGCPAGQTGMFGVCVPLPGGGAPPPSTLPQTSPSGLPPLPFPLPSAIPSSGTAPQTGNCPPGSLPNPLAPGQCVALPPVQ